MIKVENLRFSYNDDYVLSGISLEIKNGEFVGIVGPTGSGKTTLAFCLSGIIPNLVKGKLSGTVEIFGMDTRRTKLFELSRRVGFVFQDPDSQIFANNVYDEVAFALRNMGLGEKEIKRRVTESLDALGISSLVNRDTYRLSFGEKQKVCIASVLAMGTEIIILDEPTAQLDYKGTRDVYEILKNLNRKGKTIIVIEHKIDWLSRYAKRILLLRKGKIAIDGDPKKVFNEDVLREMGWFHARIQ